MTFEMPGLSRYTFHTDGRVWSKETGKWMKEVTLKGRKRSKYRLWDDRDKLDTVYIAEIIQYGKHVDATKVISKR